MGQFDTFVAVQVTNEGERDYEFPECLFIFVIGEKRTIGKIFKVIELISQYWQSDWTDMQYEQLSYQVEKSLDFEEFTPIFQCL